LILGIFYVIIMLFTGLWVLLYFCSVRWYLCGTASQGFPCCPIYFHNWQSGLASTYFLFSHLGKLWGFALC